MSSPVNAEMLCPTSCKFDSRLVAVTTISSIVGGSWATTSPCRMEATAAASGETAQPRPRPRLPILVGRPALLTVICCPLVLEEYSGALEAMLRQ